MSTSGRNTPPILLSTHSQRSLVTCACMRTPLSPCATGPPLSKVLTPKPRGRGQRPVVQSSHFDAEAVGERAGALHLQFPISNQGQRPHFMKSTTFNEAPSFRSQESQPPSLAPSGDSGTLESRHNFTSRHIFSFTIWLISLAQPKTLKSLLYWHSLKLTLISGVAILFN